MDPRVVALEVILWSPIVAYVLWLFISFGTTRGRARLEQKRSDLQAAGIKPAANRVKLGHLGGLPFATASLALLIYWGSADLSQEVTPDFAQIMTAFMSWASLSVPYTLLLMLVANHAEQKDRSWAAFFWLSFIATPLITGLIIATIKPTKVT